MCHTVEKWKSLLSDRPLGLLRGAGDGLVFHLLTAAALMKPLLEVVTDTGIACLFLPYHFKAPGTCTAAASA